MSGSFVFFKQFQDKMYDVMSLFTNYLLFTTINNDIYLGAIKQGRHLLIKEQLMQSTIRSSWQFKNRSKTLLLSEYKYNAKISSSLRHYTDVCI